ncbi:protein shisa-1-like [Megalops cyprinoides]|uniref:protein shisa-1-like n=1 Tax=Megalops cyprinoides TaxID=118141 RepID=UPI001864DDF8|nr:protein shisa-1-like [Megalops cyprinoides]
MAALMLIGVASTGEYCHGWADAYNIWHNGFQCPERYDGQDAKYCCGTCTLRYCCTAVEARLDQTTCDNDNFFEFENDMHAVMFFSSVPTYMPFLIVASVFLSFVLVGSIVAICCCQCLRPKPGDCQSGSAPIQSHLLESGASSDGLPQPCPYRVSPGSSSAERQQNDGDTGTEDTTGTVSMCAPEGRGGYPTPGAQGKQYLPPSQPLGPFFQPQFLSYRIPPEHAVLMTPAYLDGRTTYGQQEAYSFPQAPMHMEPIYPAIPM